MSGPISEAIEQEIRGELTKHGIVIWLDKDASFSRLVDDLASRRAKGDFPAPVAAFRGSFLDLLLQLDGQGAGLDRQPLLIHMPGFNEESIRKTPVLELYEAGVRFRKSLDTLVRERATSRVTPHEVDQFLAKSPTLEEADTWLDAAVSQSAVGLAAVLNEIGPALLVQALGRDDSTLAARVTTDDELGVLRGYLHKLTGVDDAWIEWFGADARRRPLASLLEAATAWLLSVEYVHDLRRPPYLPALVRLKEISPALVKSCSEILNQLRRDHGDVYARMADEVESNLLAELKAMTPEDLGQIDTFREEENRVLEGAVAALQKADWSKARGWCEARHGEKSFWLARDPSRRFAWSLVEEAARFGETLASHPKPLAGARGLEDVARRYADGGYEVDRAHRRFEQKRLMLLEPHLPHFGLLQEVVGALRKEHRAWADTLARDFAAVCVEHGFLPPDTLQQRTLYEQVVHPLASSGEKVAFFLIDAFRYEMATELVEEMTGAGGVVDLKARYAELPTITSVGMNVLAPVAQGGRLVIAGTLEGFKTGEFTVRKPEDRARAMGVRSTGKAALLVSLSEVCEQTTAALTKQVKQNGLIVVHSKEIDDAGEANMGLPTFESSLRQIKAAWRHLQLAGVKNFVFTADHGFLIQDETTRKQEYGTKRTPKRRHILDDHPRQEPGMVPVSLSSLNYDGLGGYLLFRDDTAVFDTGNAGATFVHGGNSLQERLIPVLVVTRKRVEAGGLTDYVVEAEPLTGVLGLHRLRLRVVLKRTTLDYATARAVDVAIRAEGRPEVQVTVKEAAGGGKLRGGRLEVPIGETWTEVFFGLQGPQDDRVRIEVHHPDGVERVTTALVDAWFPVSGFAGSVAATAPGGAKVPSVLPPSPANWADAFADEGIRKVFLHIEKHGLVDEAEVTTMLGSPREFRKFSRDFDVHLAKLPFRVKIDTADGGKRYVREGEK